MVGGGILSTEMRNKRKEELGGTPPWGLLGGGTPHTHGRLFPSTLTKLGTNIEQQWINLSAVEGGFWFTPSICRDLEVDIPISSKGLVYNAHASTVTCAWFPLWMVGVIAPSVF